MSQPKDTSVSEWQILKYFSRQSLPHKRTLLLSLFMPFGAICLNIFLPFYTGKLIAELSSNPENAGHYLPYIVASAIAGAAANRIGAVNMFEHQARVLADLQMLCLTTLFKQSSAFHNNRVAGKLVSDALDFPQSYSMLANAFLLTLLPLAATVVIGLALVGAKSWVLGLVLFGMVSSAVIGALFNSHVRKPIRARRLKAQKAVTAHLADTIVNHQTVKTFARETEELATHHALNQTLLKIRINDWHSGAKAGNWRITGLLIFQVIFAAVVIDVVKKDPSSLGIGIFAFSYSLMLASSLFSLNTLLIQIENALLQASPFIDILNMTLAIQDNKKSDILHVTKGAVTFKDVSFSYQDSPTPENIFTSLNIAIKPGEKIGLVGPSGGGKSTLTRLLLRFDDIQSGSILIDGQDIAAVQQRSVRQAIAYVPQEPLMFHRSVRENIAYGNMGASEEAIIEAAKKANAHDFIIELANGYDTLVGERGVKLSGGQRQRVAIARAILKDAPILLLDEATSALDSESEVLIQQALLKLMQDRTTLVIAHRLSTIQKMDRILVLEDGRITEEGDHQTLLRNKGTYARLWTHQSGGFLED